MRLARTSRRNFYEHFEDRDGCFLALFDSANQSMLDRIAAAVDPESSLEQQVDRAVEAYVDSVIAQPALWASFVREMPGLGRAGAERAQLTLERFAQTLIELVEGRAPRPARERRAPAGHGHRDHHRRRVARAARVLAAAGPGDARAARERRAHDQGNPQRRADVTGLRRRPGAPARVPIDGRTAFISGAASGIGRAVAALLAGRGCPIAICDQDGVGLQEAESAIAGPVLARVLDVRDRQAQLTFAAEVAEWAPSPLGMVFNNAGVAATQTVAGGSIEDDEWVLDVNLGGVVNGTRAFLPILQRQGSGVIVNVSSVFGLVGIPGQSAYCASKFAIRGFTDSLRQELTLKQSGVSACVVHPGGVRTNIARNARLRSDARGREVTRERAVAQFDSLAFTSPERAAKIIHRGVAAGRSRVLIGPDAHVFDVLGRAMPTNYFRVLRLLESLPRP